METGRISEGSGGSPGFSSSGFDKREFRAGSNWESYSASGAGSPPRRPQRESFFCSFFHALTGIGQRNGKVFGGLDFRAAWQARQPIGGGQFRGRKPRCA